MGVLRTLLFLLIFAPLTGAQAQAYKWVDENGQVHYGQQPPVRGKAESVPLPSRRADSGALEDLRQRNDAATRSRQDSADAAAQQQAEAERARMRNEACSKMRANLDVLQTRNRVRELKGAEYVSLSREEQQSRIEDLQQQIGEHCQEQ